MPKKYYVLEWDRYYRANPMVSIYDLKPVVIGMWLFGKGSNAFYLYRTTTDGLSTDISANDCDAHVYSFKSKRDAYMFMRGIEFGDLNAYGWIAETDDTSLLQIRATSGYTGKSDEPFSTHLYKMLDRGQLQAVLASEVFTTHTTPNGHDEAVKAMARIRSGFKGQYRNATVDEHLDFELTYTEFEYFDC